MELHGRQLIGAETSSGGDAAFTAVDPRSGDALPPEYRDATAAEVDRAMATAADAHPAFELAGRERRAVLLETIAARIEALGAALTERASAETGLPIARIENERGRTCGQLRLFARVVRDGDHLDLRIDRPDRARKPLPKPDLRSMQRAIGPVAVFGASNFPLAFSVAGGDTAAALAAGCPVVVKAHPNHPGTSELVARAITAAVQELDLPSGTFSMLHGRSEAVGAALVLHPATRAVAFTGSLRGGRALFDLATGRRDPIWVFAEMGSTNPVFLLPQRLAEAGTELASGLAASMTLGVGQFCTKPGLVVAQRGAALESFVDGLVAKLREQSEGVLLHAGIRQGYDAGIAALTAVTGVEVVHRGTAAGPCGALPTLTRVDAKTFLATPALHDEVFGPATLVVTCADTGEMLAVARGLAGQLTATVHATAADLAATEGLVPLLEQRAGRLVFGGFPTGVEVGDAMVHGGPWPATTDARSTSVGTAAIHRFTRPVCYQDFPDERLPTELRDDAPPGPARRIDGRLVLRDSENP